MCAPGTANKLKQKVIRHLDGRWWLVNTHNTLDRHQSVFTWRFSSFCSRHVVELCQSRRNHSAVHDSKSDFRNHCRLCRLFTAEDLTVKTFSVVAATQHVIGQNLNSFALHNIQDPEDKEVARRRIDCRKQLLTMKAGNVESDSEPTGQSVLQQEDLQVKEKSVGFIPFRAILVNNHMLNSPDL